MKKIFKTKETINKKIHKVYLLLALIIGVTLSIAMPFFNEPDGQYHYTASTNIAGLSNDLSAYGEVAIGSGIDQQLERYQRGNYFEAYYKNKIKKMQIKSLPRLNYVPKKTNYDYWGHIIPAIGVKLGYMIYPSLGVMIVVARLLMTFLCSIAMFLIIKWVKAGKLLFVVVSLSPVITNTFASLSYDATNYVLASFTVACAINIVVRRNILFRDFIYLLLSSIALLFGSKTNTMLLISLIPLVILVTFLRSKREERKEPVIRKRRARNNDHSWYSWKKLWIILSLLISVLVLVIIFKPTVVFNLYRVVINYLINVNPGLTPGSIFQSTLASPYPGVNYIPLWVSSLWYILIVLVLFAEEKYVWSKWLSLFAVVLFVLGIVAVFYKYTNFVTVGPKVSSNQKIGGIVGVQGRYFTPSLLLLSLWAGYDKFNLKIKSYKFVTILSIIVIVISNALLLFGTLFPIYYL